MHGFGSHALLSAGPRRRWHRSSNSHHHTHAFM